MTSATYSSGVRRASLPLEPLAVVSTMPSAWRVHASANVMHDGSLRSVCGKTYLQPDGGTFAESLEYERCQRCVRIIRERSNDG